MKKTLLFALSFVLITTLGYSQNGKYWASHNDASGKIITDKAVARLAYPKEFKLFDLNANSLRQDLFSIVGSHPSSSSTIISLPNAAGGVEQFEVFEASNFEPALQAQFPQIRAFSGNGITDKSASLKLSISPQGIQTMVFRAGKESEYIEPYSQDHTIYSVFKSQRAKGQLPWTCSTPDANLATALNSQVLLSQRPESNTGELKTMRLAQSCNGEYSNFFGATSAAQVGLVLAAYNATLTRCNGCYEKDLALHLNLIANTADVIYYNPATDPYTTLGAWNGQLQATLNTVIGAANYDIGHMFGASGGGGNAGCIGCVCNDANKGSGITSPADGIPQGDNFDIDYVAHEVGHQLGGNHTYSHVNEGTGVNKEVGSGITIMGYAGITGQDVAPHSIAFFHQASIQQIQNNLATKTCPITTNITANNATPVLAPVAARFIPISTPFTLTGSATDANAADVLTYQWEQNDNSTTTGANSVASPTKLTGPNWLSFSPTTNPTRTFPILATVLAGANVTGPLPGGDAGANIEALSSVSRTLNFRLTVRDNSAYVPFTTPGTGKVGQTAFTDVAVSVDATSGPFQVTSPNTNVSYQGGTIQTITWDVNNTTAAPVSCANVKISYSTDGGLTFPTVLSASTANDGTEALTIPVGVTTTARIKIEAVGNIFFDISNSNFTVTAPPNGFEFTATAALTLSCPAGTPTITIPTTVTGVFSTPIVLTTSSVPAGTTVTFAPSPVTPGVSTVATLNNASTLAPGTYVITVTGTAGAVIKTTTLTFIVPSSAAVTANPTDQAVCTGTSATFTANGTGNGVVFQWQSSLSATGPWASVVGGTGGNTITYTTPVTTPTTPITYYRLNVTTTACAGNANSTVARLIVNTVASITTQPLPQTVCSPSPASFTTAGIGTGLSYQWQVSTTAVPTFTNITGATNATYTVATSAATDNGNKYRVNIFSTCSPTIPTTSNEVLLTVNTPVTISQNPLVQSGCSGINAQYAVTAAGTGLTYQWQLSTNNGTTYTAIPGATTSSYSIPNAPVILNGNLYNVVVTGTCNSLTSTPAKLNLSIKPTIVLTAPATSAVNAAVNQGLFTTISPANFVGTFNWTKNGTAIPNTLASTFILLPVDAIGKYQVSTTDALTGCVSTSNELDVKTPDNIAEGRLFVYPNPVSNIMQVRFNFPNVGTTGTMLNIYDGKGARVMSIPYTLTGTFGRMVVDMSKVQLGAYMVYLMDASGKKLGSTKVVKVQ
jgi:hypothetical protein